MATRVQGTTNSDGSYVTSFTLTFASPISSGNTVVGALTWSPTSVNVTSIVDNQSNNYSIVHSFNDTPDDQRIVAFSCKNITNAPTVITLTFSGGAGFKSGIADEFSSVEGTVAGFAGQVQVNMGTTTDVVTSGNITGGVTDDLVWGCTFGTGGQGTPAVIGTGFTVGTTTTATVTARSEYKTLTGAGTTAVTYTAIAANDVWSTVGAVFSGVAFDGIHADAGSYALTGTTAGLKVGPWELVGIGTSVQVTAASHALTLPAGVQQNDLLVAVISSRIASTTSITLPTGGEWTLVAENKSNNTLTTTSALASGMMAYCIRGASDPNLTFTHPAAPSVALGRIVAYRGVDPASPKDTQNAVLTATNTTSVNVAGVTTAGVGELLVVGLCGGQEATWSAVDATNPSVASGATNTTQNPTYNTWLERAEQVTTTGSDTSLAIADAVKSVAGATGNITATASLGAGHVVLIGAFKPVPVSLSKTIVAEAGSYTLTGTVATLTKFTPGKVRPPFPPPVRFMRRRR